MAANAGAIRAGKAFIDFTLSDKQVIGQLRNLQKRFNSIGSSLRRIGAVGLAVGGAINAAFAGAAKVFASTGDTLDKMRHRTGVSVEALTGLEFAASQTGTSFETVEKGFAGLSRTFFEAKRGSAVAVDALGEIGLSFSDLEGLSPDRQMEIIADSLSKVEDESIRGAVAQNIFGRAGRQLLPLLKLGSKGIRDYRNEAEELGITLTDEDAVAAAELTDALDRMWRQVKAVSVQIGAAVAGPLTDLLAATKPIIATVINWVKNNWPLIRTVAAIGLAVTAAGGTLIGLGLGFSLLGVAAGGLATVIGAVGTVLAAIVSPIGAVVVAVTGGVAAFLKFTDTGNSMVESLVSGFVWLKDTFMVSIKAISAALSAGDMAAAGEVLWATLKLLWLEGTQSLQGTWHGAMGVIVKAWHTTWAGMLQLVNASWSNMERGWSHTVEFFANTWESMIGGLKRSWNTTTAFLQKTWLRMKGFFGSDVKDEIDQINQELEIANKKIRDDTTASKGRRSERAERTRERSRELQQGVLDVIGEDLARKLEKSDDATKGRISAAKQQLEDARAAWKDATKAAEAAGEEAAKRKKLTQETGNEVEEAAKGALTGMSRGTFNATNLLALAGGPGGPEEETAKNTKRMADDLRQIKRGGGATQLTVP